MVKKENKKTKEIEKESENNILQTNKKFLSKPMIAGILLIFTGIISMMALTPLFTIDDATIDDLRENNDVFKEYAEGKSNEQIKNDYSTNGTIGAVIFIFPIIGGIFAVRKKGWLISLFGGLVAIIFLIFLFPVPLSIILASIAIVLIIFSKDEFQKNLNIDISKIKKSDN